MNVTKHKFRRKLRISIGWSEKEIFFWQSELELSYGYVVSILVYQKIMHQYLLIKARMMNNYILFFSAFYPAHSHFPCSHDDIINTLGWVFIYTSQMLMRILAVRTTPIGGRSAPTPLQAVFLYWKLWALRSSAWEFALWVPASFSSFGCVVSSFL